MVGLGALQSVVPVGNWCCGVCPGIVVLFLLVVIPTGDCGTGLRWEAITAGTMMLASVWLRVTRCSVERKGDLRNLSAWFELRLQRKTKSSREGLVGRTCSRGSSVSGGRVRCEKGQQGWTLSSTVPRENPARPLGPQFGSRRGDPSPHGLGGWSPPVQYEGSLSLQRQSTFRCLRCQRAELISASCSPWIGMRTVRPALPTYSRHRIGTRIPLFGRCFKRLFPREQVQSPQALRGFRLKARILGVLIWEVREIPEPGGVKLRIGQQTVLGPHLIGQQS